MCAQIRESNSRGHWLTMEVELVMSGRAEIGMVVDGDNVVDDGFEGRRRNESGSIYT